MLNRLLNSAALISLALLALRPSEARAVNYRYPELYRCTFPTASSPCMEDKTAREYPLQSARTGQPFSGCYTKEMKRLSTIPSGANAICNNANTPLRVRAEYITLCPDTSTIVACPTDPAKKCCTKGAQIKVRPSIVGETTETITTKILPNFEKDDGKFTAIALGESSVNNPAKQACDSLPGFGWDPTTESCNFDSIAQCQALGLRWENDQCLDKCSPEFCTKRACAGYVYQPNYSTCFCVGDSTTSDDNGRPCTDATPSPNPTTTGSPSPTGGSCYATIKFKNEIFGATNHLKIIFPDHVEKYSLSGSGSGTKIAVACHLLSFEISSGESFPVRCVSCDGSEKTCDQREGVITTCGPTTLDNGRNFEIRIYAK